MQEAAAHKSTSKPRRVLSKMSPIGVLLWLTGTVRMHKDGDGFKAIWRAWHPVTWLMVVIMVVPCAVMGVALKEVFPLKLSKFWQQNRDQLQFVTPWTKLDSLKPFKSKIGLKASNEDSQSL